MCMCIIHLWFLNVAEPRGRGAISCFGEPPLLPVNKMARKSALSLVRDQAKVGALKHLTLGSSKTAGRNSSGRITSYHRGGGAKRLQRKVDVKRGTSSLGIVERIEYDPNRSSSIALVRWVQGVHFRRPKALQELSAKPQILESVTAYVSGRFPRAALSGRVHKEKKASALYSSLGNAWRYCIC